MTYLIALLLSLALLIVGIIKFKVHPFFVLLFSALAYGFMTGMDIETIINAVNNGFGDIMGKIGLIILFGVTIGKVLEKSGGAFVIASKILALIGSKSIHLAMLITGYILSVPVFADSALLIMNPLNKVLSKKAGVSFAGTTAALALGLTASHTMVPPTPGPIAAAGILGADLGSVMIYGILISSISLIACYFFATKIASRIDLPIAFEAVVTKHEKPALWKSLLAIVIPILLIVCKSIMDYPEFTFEPSIFKTLISFLGTPVMALLVGVLLSLVLPKKLDEKIFSATGWFGESLREAAPIIFITGAGGIFGRMLQNSGIADTITSEFTGMQLGLFLPFLLAACLKTTQGSSTVSLVTTASIIAPLMGSLGLSDPLMATLTVLSIGAGASVVSHVNDSFFWVLTQLTGMNVKQGYQIQSAGTFVFGVTSMIIITILSKILV